MATSAAAPPPTALNSETSCGMAVIATRRARYRPMPPPMRKPTTMMHDGSCRQPARAQEQPDERGHHGQRHAAGRQAVAAARRGRRVHLVQAEHERGRAGQPGQEDEGVDPLLAIMGTALPSAVVVGLGRRRLALAEHLEHAVGDDVAADDVRRAEDHGDERKQRSRAGCRPSAAMSIAPTRTMPWIELAPDISGVCSVAGTLLMTSKPTRMASTKMASALSSSWAHGASCLSGSRSFFVASWTTAPSLVMTVAAVISSLMSRFSCAVLQQVEQERA